MDIFINECVRKYVCVSVCPCVNIYVCVCVYDLLLFPWCWCLSWCLYSLISAFLLFLVMCSVMLYKCGMYD